MTQPDGWMRATRLAIVTAFGVGSLWSSASAGVMDCPLSPVYEVHFQHEHHSPVSVYLEDRGSQMSSWNAPLWLDVLVSTVGAAAGVFLGFLLSRWQDETKRRRVARDLLGFISPQVHHNIDLVRQVSDQLKRNITPTYGLDLAGLAPFSALDLAAHSHGQLLDQFYRFRFELDHFDRKLRSYFELQTVGGQPAMGPVLVASLQAQVSIVEKLGGDLLTTIATERARLKGSRVRLGG